MSLHDPETGLPGRALLLDRLAVAAARQERTATTVALMLIDAGEGGPVAAAESLRGFVRSGDTVARSAPGELAVIADDLSSVAEAEAIAERALRLLGAAVSIGLVVTDGHGARSGEQLLEDAERSLARARLNGGGYEHFDPGVRERALAEAHSDAELRSAIASGELRLHYQPIVGIDDGLARGVEALVRWEHPEHGTLAPDEFVPMAETSGAIFPLGDWVLRDACRQMRAWHATHRGAEGLWLAVNLSAAQLRHPAIEGVVARALSESGLEPELLYLEVAQADLEADKAVAASLRRLRAGGVRISLDGADAGSREAAGAVTIDMVKAGPASIKAVLAAWNGHAEVVAHHVEDRDHEAALRALGCHLGQGYLYARPAPAHELEALIAIADQELVES